MTSMATVPRYIQVTRKRALQVKRPRYVCSQLAKNRRIPLVHDILRVSNCLQHSPKLLRVSKIWDLKRKERDVF